METPIIMGWDPTDLADATRCLSKRLKGNEPRQRDVEDILRRYVGDRQLTTFSWSDLYKALQLYVDDDFAGWLLGYLSNANEDPDLLKAFDERLEPGTAGYLRKLLAFFGADLTEARSIGDENPAGWRKMDREVYFDLLNSSWRIRINLIRYNGEIAQLEETPNSVLILTLGLLETVVTAATNGGLDVLDLDQTKSFLLAVEDLEKLVIQTSDVAAGAIDSRPADAAMPAQT